MYFCAAILLLVKFFFLYQKSFSNAHTFSPIIQSYLIGLWFSLRTHASQIWQNPQQLLHPMELPTHRNSLYNKLGQSTATAQRPPSVNRSGVSIVNMNVPSQTGTPLPRETSTSTSAPQTGCPTSPSQRKVFVSQQQTGLHPVLESVDHAVKNSDLRNLQIPETTDDFTRAVTVATVSALRHQQRTHHSPGRLRSAVEHESTGAGGGHGGHDAPSWSRTTSASVLLACTALYAIIAGICFDPSF